MVLRKKYIDGVGPGLKTKSRFSPKYRGWRGLTCSVSALKAKGRSRGRRTSAQQRVLNILCYFYTFLLTINSLPKERLLPPGFVADDFRSVCPA